MLRPRIARNEKIADSRPETTRTRRRTSWFRGFVADRNSTESSKTSPRRHDPGDVGSSAQPRRRRSLLRRLLERIRQLQQLWLAARAAGEADAERLRLGGESLRH